MSSAIGDLLPLAVGVAISPIPIIATILMLLSARAGTTSTGFLVGWVSGVVAATTLFTVLTSGVADESTSDSGVAWLKVALGVLLLLLALRQWRGRPRAGESAAVPAWMSSIDSFGFGKSLGLGFVLSAVNPKNLILCAGAGAVIGGSALSVGEDAVAIAVFTLVAVSTVLVPVVGYAVAKDRLSAPLAELKTWLQEHNAAVMSVLLLVLGVALIGKGLG
jgi:Sap, sulfolipid-1-addressing protein